MTPAPLIDPFVPWLPADTAPAEAPAAGTADQDGPVALAGARLAVKDVIDVQGAPTGSGHPLLLAAAAPAPRTPPPSRACCPRAPGTPERPTPTNSPTASAAPTPTTAPPPTPPHRAG